MRRLKRLAKEWTGESYKRSRRKLKEDNEVLSQMRLRNSRARDLRQSRSRAKGGQPPPKFFPSASSRSHIKLAIGIFRHGHSLFSLCGLPRPCFVRTKAFILDIIGTPVRQETPRAHPGLSPWTPTVVQASRHWSLRRCYDPFRQQDF